MMNVYVLAVYIFFCYRVGGVSGSAVVLIAHGDAVDAVPLFIGAAPRELRHAASAVALLGGDVADFPPFVGPAEDIAARTQVQAVVFLDVFPMCFYVVGL